VRVSWLEDFSDGEAIWKRLMTAPTFAAFLDQLGRLSDAERDTLTVYHAIRERQAAGNWNDWAGGNDDSEGVA
jgi:hypothetical protein